MHPAYSVIFFTTSSGAGYGLLFWLSLAEILVPGLLDRWPALAALVLALMLISAGLLASTYHLGHPERALGALSQWRSSWLSREAVAAVATYIPAGLLGIIWIAGLPEGMVPVLAGLSATGAIATVFCTGMIYASLRTIRQWNRPDLPWIFLALAAATGGLLFALFAAFAGAGLQASLVSVMSLSVGAGVKLRYWSAIDAEKPRYSVEDALGVPGLTSVRSLDPPHDRPNFVMREMGYTVARKHVEKLRQFVLINLFAVPLALVLIGALSGWFIAAFSLAILMATLGVVVERWLLFAEAEHVSQLYY